MIERKFALNNFLALLIKRVPFDACFTVVNVHTWKYTWKKIWRETSGFGGRLSPSPCFVFALIWSINA